MDVILSSIGIIFALILVLGLLAWSIFRIYMLVDNWRNLKAIRSILENSAPLSQDDMKSFVESLVENLD